MESMSGMTPPPTSPAAADNGPAPKMVSIARVATATPDDAGVPMPVDMAGQSIPDLASTDLAGLTNCYGMAVCDPTQMFCIRYYDGSQAAPGKLSFGPACYEPGTPCADNNQNMDCGCIQNDDNLGPLCQGSCVDNMNGTFDCYAL
jgi:hypothetical protein